jgi:hypothetical protein
MTAVDGLVGSRKEPMGWCAALFEYENELGSTRADKYFQGMNYYGRVCIGNKECAARTHSCFPCLLVEMRGCFIR